jgi:hypothetical protein
VARSDALVVSHQPAVADGFGRVRKAKQLPLLTMVTG